MEVIDFDFDKHFSMVSFWATQYGWMPLTKEQLPQTGVIAVKDGIPVCSCFLFETNSETAILEWCIGNKSVPWEARDEGIKAVVSTLTTRAKEAGYKIVVTFCIHERLIEKYKSLGAIVGDKNVTSLVWTF